MEDTGDEEILGPGADLAFAFAGMLMVVAVLAVVQLWIVSQNVSKIPKLEIEVAEAQKLLPKLMKDLEDEKARSIALGKANKELLDKLAQAEKKYRDLKEAVGTTRSDYAELKHKADGLEKELGAAKAAKARAEDLARQLALADAELQSIRSGFVKIREERSLLKTQIALLSAALSGERAAHATLRTKYNDLAARFRRLVAIDTDNTALRSKMSALEREIDALNKKLNDRPPIITISDDDVHTFDTASAKMSPQLLDKLEKDIAPRLAQLGVKYSAHVIEVVGHTDEIKVKATFKQKCNLDEALLDVLNEKDEQAELVGCDNIGLGMARAVSVVMALKRLGLGARFQIIPLSAGQVVEVGDTVSAGEKSKIDDRKRRRIEIRLRRTRE